MNWKRIRCQVFLVIILVLGVLGASAAQIRAEMVSIAGDDVNMRSGPGTGYRVLWELGRGFPLQVLKRSGNWCRVKDFEGSIGWIHKDVASSIPHMIVKANKNSNKRINIRSGPGTHHGVVAQAHYGVVFATLEQKNGWVNIRHEDGVTGWVDRHLLWGW